MEFGNRDETTSAVGENTNDFVFMMRSDVFQKTFSCQTDFDICKRHLRQRNLEVNRIEFKRTIKK